MNLSPAPAADITLSYTVDGTATSGSDYTALSGTVAVSAGATTATVPVAIIDDSLKEDSETVVLTLATGSGYELGSPGTHTLTIAASDGPPQVSFEPIEGSTDANTPTWWVKEGSGPHDVKVRLNPPPTSTVTINYKVSGNAIPGSDHTALSGTLSVPKGATTATIPVTIIDDDEREFAEEIVLLLLGGTGYELARPMRHLVIIDPSDGLPWVSLVPVQQSAGEGSGTQEVGVRLGPAPATDIAFSYTVEGTATSGSDYKALSGSVTVSRGATTAKIPVTLIDDSLKEGSEKVILKLTGSAGYKVTSPGTHTLTIVDDETPASLEPQVTIAAGASPVTEGSDATFTVTASPAPASPLAVSVTVATDGDYGVTAGERTVTIPTTGSATLTLATANDEADEPDGSVSVTVAAGEGYTVGDPASGTVAIADDDPATAVATVDPALVAQVRGYAAETDQGQAHVDRWMRVLAAFGDDNNGYTAMTAEVQTYADRGWQRWVPVVDALEALEALEAAPEPPPQPVTLPAVTVSAGADVTEGGDAVFTVTASPAPASALTVSVTVATAGEFGVTAGSQSVTIPTTGSATLTLATANDEVDEADGSVSVTVAAGEGYTVGDPASGTVAVRDDDEPPPAITVSAGDAVTEGGDAIFTVTASPAPASPLAVSVTVAAKGDYGIASGTQTVSIPTTGSATLTLATANDDADEPDGSVNVTAAAGDGYTVGDPASGSVSIADDDLPPPAVSITAKVASVTEGGAAAFTITADRAPDADLTVTLSVAETGGGDHVAAVDEGPATATIAKGATEAAFSVATVDDDVDEPDGSVTVTLKGGGGYTVPSPPGNAATVAVSDNDAAAGPVLSVDDATGQENGRLPAMPFTVRLSAPVQDAVRVYVSTRPSTPVSATPKVDYAPASYALTFRAGETEKQVWVMIHNDSHDEEPETFEVVLSKAQGAPIGDGVAVGTIVNDDPMPAAWLGRFGRTVAEQALDGVAGRMSADRTPGMQGAIAGQALSFDPAANDIARRGTGSTRRPACRSGRRSRCG